MICSCIWIPAYASDHNTIQFDCLYEHREYEIIATFLFSSVLCIRRRIQFYMFFQADTQEELDDWYDNIKDLSLYNAGVTAEFGDTFITLSCYSYQIEDGRFVVVGKRIK